MDRFPEAEVRLPLASGWHAAPHGGELTPIKHQNENPLLNENTVEANSEASSMKCTHLQNIMNITGF